MVYFRKSTENLSLEKVESEFQKLQRPIKDLLYKLGDNCDNLQLDPENLDESFLRDQYFKVANQLDDIYSDIQYLSKPIVDKGFIHLNKAGRYELPSGRYFTSGSVLEVLYNNTHFNEQYWVKTSIEHNGENYYAGALGREVSINGMMVRVRD